MALAVARPRVAHVGVDWRAQPSGIFASESSTRARPWACEVTAKSCPFCGAIGVRFSKEHWLPRDWGEHFPRLPGLVSADHRYGVHSSSRIENLSHFDRQFSGICATCNNGWLRELDVVAKETALDLAFLRRRHVRADEVLCLSSSLYRASLIGMWGKRQQYGVPLRRYRAFYNERRPPRGVHLMLGHNRGGYLFAGGNYSAVTLDGDPSVAIRCFAFGGLGHLFVVALISEPELDPAVRKVARAVKRAARSTLVTLWPNSRHRVTLASREITRESAQGATELGLVLGLRSSPTEVDFTDLQSRYPDTASVLRRLRPATKPYP